MATKTSPNRVAERAIFTAPVRWRKPSLREWGLAVAAALVLTAITAALVAGQSPTYESRAVLQIDQPLAVAKSGDEGVLLKLARLRNKYGDLVSTAPMVAPIAARLGVPAGRVASSVVADAPPSSLLTFVVGRGDSPGFSRRLAQAAAEEIVTFAADEQAAAAVPVDQRYIFRVVNPAVAAAKISPRRSKIVAVSAVVGIITLAAALLLAQVMARLRLR